MNEPRSPLLDRQIEKQLRSSVDRASNMIDRCVNYGTHLVARCDAAARERRLLAATLLGLHAVEALDAIAVLVRRSCADPAKVLLRSQMEAMFGIEYMAAGGSGEAERRSLQYEVGHVHNRLDWYRRLDPTHETGRQLQAQLRKDSTFGELDLVTLDTSEEITNLARMLARPDYAQIEAEWQRMRRAKGGKVTWYSLFGGPRNIEGLAAFLDSQGLYELVYRLYSGEAHAANALDSLHRSADGRATYQPLRYPVGLPSVVQFGVSMALRTYRCLTRVFLPPAAMAEYTDWYVAQVKPDYDGLGGFRILDPDRPKRAPKKRANGR